MTNNELLADLKARLADMTARVVAGPKWKKLTCRELYQDDPVSYSKKDEDLMKQRREEIKRWRDNQRNLIGYLQEQIVRLGGEL